MSCDGYMNNCDCRNCKIQEARRHVVLDNTGCANCDNYRDHVDLGKHAAITRLPLTSVFHCTFCADESFAYYMIERPDSALYLCATHFGPELYRLMKGFNITRINFPLPS